MHDVKTRTPPERVVARGLPWIILAAVVLLFVTPIAMLVFGAFRDAAPGQPSNWSLEGFKRAFSDPATAKAFGNSLGLGVAMGVIGTGIAAVFAYISARSSGRAARLITPLMVLILAMPPLFFALSWDILGTPKLGLINQTLTSWGLPSLIIGGAVGTAFVGGVKVASLVYFILLGPFRSMDHRLEEAARIFGSSVVGTFFRVTLPTLAPGLVGGFIIAFIIGLTAFDVPLIIGLPDGFSVFSTQIYGYLNETSPPNYASAGALAIVLVSTVIAVVAFRWWLLDRRSFTTVGGKSGGQRAEETRGARSLALVAVAVLAFVALILPVAQMTIASFQRVFGSNSSLSLVNYQRIFRDPNIGEMLGNTLALASLGGLIAVVLAFCLASLGRYGNKFMRRALDLTTWLPWAANGVLLGLGLVWTFLAIAPLRGLFGTIWILLIGLVVAATPLASRTIEAAMSQIGRELEEAGRISGASAIRVSIDIVLRLMLPAFLSAWFICAINIIGNLEVPILLSTPTNPTLPVAVYRLYSNGQGTQAAALFCLVLAMSCIVAGLGWLAMKGLHAARRRMAASGSVPPATTALPEPPELPERIPALIERN